MYYGNYRQRNTDFEIAERELSKIFRRFCQHFGKCCDRLSEGGGSGCIGKSGLYFTLIIINNYKIFWEENNTKQIQTALFLIPTA